jgi:hypothetical protein
MVIHDLVSYKSPSLQPFFTPTQIDCFCRPSWLRSRNWTDQDFELALTLRKLMSKKAFGYLRKKRVVPMPSLTSLRKYQRQHGIVIHTTPTKPDPTSRAVARKRPKSSSPQVCQKQEEEANKCRQSIYLCHQWLPTHMMYSRFRLSTQMARPLALFKESWRQPIQLRFKQYNCKWSTITGLPRLPG